MIWIVKLDNPKPEKYITVYERISLTEDRFLSKEKYKVFENKENAIKEATLLMAKYSLDVIRLFYEEGYSKNLKINPSL
ncbi:MAG: hypothetical protein AB8B73_16325 [Ekhidna sp.]